MTEPAAPRNATPPREAKPEPALAEDAVPPWADVVAKGGPHEWARSELARRNLLDEDVDTSQLSAAEKKRFRIRREEERRVKKALLRAAWAAYRNAHVVHVGVGVFYHDTADIDRFDIDDPVARRRENDLPDLDDAAALATALGLSVPQLRWLAYDRDVDSGTHYVRWTIPKRDGTARLISAPKPRLKRVQRWIAHHITEHLPVHNAAHGFVPGRSIKTNAAAHANAQVVAKLDLKAFYPTVTWRRVRGLFRKAGYGEQVATLLALLVTDSPREEVEVRDGAYFVAAGPRSLPQGAPTSPSITNAVCLRLDLRLQLIARSLGFRYTRYADDLTFSWHQSARAPIGRLLGAVGRVITEEGFMVHRQKTRVLRSGRQQKVTGLIVNGAADGLPLARVPRRTIRQLRAAIKNRELGRSGPETLDELQGLAAHIYMADPSKGRGFLERIAELRRSQDGGPEPE